MPKKSKKKKYKSVNRAFTTTDKKQAARFNGSKAPLSMFLEAPNAMAVTSRVLEIGASKYERGNWKAGFPYTEIIDSMLRHILLFINGQDNDTEHGLPHVGGIMCNALFLAETYYTHPEFDNRTFMDSVQLVELEDLLKQEPLVQQFIEGLK